MKIITNRPLSLGLGFNALVLKPGKHEIADSYASEWWFDALVKEGTIKVLEEKAQELVILNPADVVTVDFKAEGPVIVSIVEASGDNDDLEESDKTSKNVEEDFDSNTASSIGQEDAEEKSPEKTLSVEDEVVSSSSEEAVDITVKASKVAPTKKRLGFRTKK